MQRLNRSVLKVHVAGPAPINAGSLEKFPERIVQFGEGNFLRAFVDWMVDEVNSRGVLRSQVVAVQPIRQGLASMLNEQDGVYTVLARGVQGGEVVESCRVVTAVSRALDAYANWEELKRLFTTRELRFVLSNTTEAGITYVAESLDLARTPESFPAKIAALLYVRYQALKGIATGGLVFLPCELIDANGTHLRACVLKHIAAWGLPADFAAWVGHSNHFLNTLVDRIVPGYPKAEAAAVCEKLGFEDRLIVTAEHFHLWVIEGLRELEQELPFARAGLNVVWTDRMAPYRNRKVRVLNGAHTSASLAAFAAGADTVLEMMKDPVLGEFVRRAVFEEILPYVDQPEKERQAYAAAVLERFQNPFIRHELLSISLNSVSKWRVRVLPSVQDAIKATGRPPELLTFSLAALLWFYRGTLAHGVCTGDRAGNAYPIKDDAAVLQTLTAAWAKQGAATEFGAFATDLLRRSELWGTDLTALPGFADLVATHLRSIATSGMRDALTDLVEVSAA